MKKNNVYVTLLRVFTFGIGDGVSTSLVRGLARAGRGKYELIADVKNLPEKV